MGYSENFLKERGSVPGDERLKVRGERIERKLIDTILLAALNTMAETVTAGDVGKVKLCTLTLSKKWIQFFHFISSCSTNSKSLGTLL